MRSLDALLGATGYEYDQAFGTELRHWRSKLANVKLGLGTARVLIVGDSIMEGAGGAAYADQITQKFRTAIQQIWRTGGEGYVPVYRGPSITNRWTLASAPDTTDYGPGVGRRAILYYDGNNSATITFTGDRFQLWYTQAASAGNLKVTIDGGAPILFSTNNATTRSSRIWDSFTNGGVTLTRGSHTVVVKADNTLAGHTVYSAYLDGIMIFDNDYTTGIQVIEGAHSNYTTGEFYNSTLSNAANTWATGMDNVQPDLVIIELGLNDLGAPLTGVSTTIANFKTNLVGIVNNILTNGSINSPLGYTPSVVLVPLWGRSDSYGPITTGTVTSGTTLTDNTVTFTSSQTGMSITGSGVPAGTTISYVSAHVVTLSQTSTNGALTYTLQFTDAQWAPYRTATWEVALANGYAVWDMYARMGGYLGTDPDTVTADRLHPNAKGSQMIATEMVRLFTGVPDQFAVYRGDFNAPGQHVIGSADNAYTMVLPFTYWGDGSDGAWTPDGSTTVGWASRSGSVHTLTRDTNLTNLTVNSGITIITAGFRLMGNGTCSVVSGGIIHHDGGNGGNGTSGAAGAAGAAATAGSTTSAGIGGAGGAATLNAAGGNAGSVTTAIGGSGGIGGDGTSTGVPGPAGTAAAPVAARGNYKNTIALFGNMTIGPTPTAIAPGAGGGGGNGNTAAGGGGGGGGAGMQIIAFPVVTNAGTIRANGGAGGNGSGGGAGGGGGGGGASLVISALYTNTGTWTTTGGGIGTGNTTTSAPAAGSTGTTLWVKAA